MKPGAFTLLIGLLCIACPARAQKFEVSPYAGGFFPGKFAGVIDVDREGMYGIKGGMFIRRSIEVEGHLGYINNLSFKDTLTRKKAYIWESAVSYNFGARRKFYGTFGLGGVTTTISDDTRSLFDPSILTTDRFLSISYGGGVKELRRWGPFGYRVDVRARTLPDYYGFRFSWLETTAGLTFAWGER